MSPLFVYLRLKSINKQPVFLYWMWKVVFVPLFEEALYCFSLVKLKKHQKTFNQPSQWRGVCLLTYAFKCRPKHARTNFDDIIA